MPRPNGVFTLPPRAEMTQGLLKKVLAYNPETGEFRWLISTNTKVKVGDLAGVVNKTDHYRYIGMGGRKMAAHRLVFLYVYGKLPEKQVDHIDRDRTNNRLANLREATPRVNTLNRGLQSNNSSGTVGVYWDADRGKWNAQIKDHGKTKHLGSFLGLDEAIAARKLAESESRSNDI